MAEHTGATPPQDPHSVDTPDAEYADTPAPAQAVVAYGAADAAAIPPAVSPTGAGPVELPASPARAKAALVALSIAAFLVVTNEIAPMGLIARIADDLGRSQSQIGFLTTAFALVVMFASIPVARLTTTWSRKPVVLTALGVWTTGTIVVALSEGFAQLIIGRGITGLGHALFWAVATPAVAGMFPPEIRGRCVARLLLGASGAGVVGLPAATWLAQETTWRVPFIVLAGTGGLLLVLLAFVMPGFRTEEGTAARGEYPSKRRYLRILAVTILTVSSVATTFTYITPFFVEVSGFAESTVPLLLMAGGAVGMVSMWLVGRFLDRYPIRAVAVGLGLLALMWAGFAVLGGVQIVAVAMIMLQGFAWSIVVAAMLNWAIRHTPWATDIGVAAYNSTFNAGNAVGSVLGAGLLAWMGAQWLPVASLILVGAASVLVWQVGPVRRFRLSQVTRRA